MDDEGYDNNSKDGLIYDLRTYYAKIVGEHLVDVSSARKKNDLMLYYQELENLYVVIEFKIIKDEELYAKCLEVKKEVVKVINENKGSYDGTSPSSEGFGKVKNALMKLESQYMKAMNDKLMFGGFDDDDGL